MQGMRGWERLGVAFLWFAAGLTVGVLVLILGYILVQGLPSLSLEFLFTAPKKMGAEGGIFPTIVGTIYFTVLSVLFAAPIGIGAAVYLTEYTKDTWFTRLIRFATETLAGIPSIIFGLFGFAFFVILLEPVTGGWSLLSGSLTVAFMILPTIIRTAEESIKTVPNWYREGSLALGATKWETISKVVIPSALPGIVTGIILGVGRAVGETAALLLTLGGSLKMPTGIFDPARTMSMHLYTIATEVGAMDKAFGTAAVLIISIFALNSLANWLMHRFISRIS